MCEASEGKQFDRTPWYSLRGFLVTKNSTLYGNLINMYINIYARISSARVKVFVADASLAAQDESYIDQRAL